MVMAVMFGLVSCDIEPIVDPNNPAAEGVAEGATIADLRLLAAGTESALRNDIVFYYNTVSIVGREYYDLNNTDPRYVSELLGGNGAALDPGGFLTTRTYNGRHRAVRNAENLLSATANSTGLTDTDKSGINGFANTLKAYSQLLVLNHQYQNGIRLDVADPDNLGPFVTYDAALAGIATLLDGANDDLAAAGDAFAINLSSGFTGFDTPAAFSQFNRALAARVALYQGNSSKVLSLLTDSFFEFGGGLGNGVHHVFGTGSNDQLNPLFNVANSDLYTATSDWISSAEADDPRVPNNVTLLEASDELTVPVVVGSGADAVSGEYQVTTYGSNTDPIPIITNEELLLMYAEANITTNPAEAESAINQLRMTYGLPAVSGLDGPGLTNQLIHERRYSLFGQGHRWIDMRRWGRLDQIVLDRPTDVVHVQFPTPLTETE